MEHFQKQKEGNGKFKDYASVCIEGKIKSAFRDYTGKITIGSNELNEISGDMLRRHITRISHDAYIFYGTLYDNLKMDLNIYLMIYKSFFSI